MKAPFEIITVDGMHAIKNDSSVVVVAVFSRDENGLLDKLGIVTEDYPYFQNGKYSSLVMGKVEDEDPSLLFRAKQETLEEAGYAVDDEDRWIFLGELYTSKIFPDPLYCYAVDVTDLEQGKITGDGSDHESTLKFEMLQLNEARKINDSVLQSCFFKLFIHLHKNELNGIA